MTISTVYFATNRKPNKAKLANFGKGFSRDDLGDVRFWLVKVINGNIDKTSIIVLPNNPEQGSQELFNNLRKKMKSECVDSVVFIHGFNISFSDAIESAAKMAEKYAEKNYKPNVFVFS